MLLYNNKKDNRNERRVLISAMLDSNYLKTNSGYNLSHNHFSRTLAVFVCILEILNKVFYNSVMLFNCNTDILCVLLSISRSISY